MRSVSGIAALGCAVSLQCNNDGYSAIRVLELSRGAINRLTINSKADLSMLYRLYPDLAKQFKDLRFLVNSPTEGRAHESKATSLRQFVVSELDDLISKIRTKKGFEDFQDLPSKYKLLETAPNQSTILLNTTKFRTDALLVHSDTRIQALPLSQSIYQHSREYYGRISDRFGYDVKDGNTWLPANVDMRSFLEWLWDEIIGPVLHAFKLRLLESLSEYNLPENLAKAARLTVKRQTDRLQYSNPN